MLKGKWVLSLGGIGVLVGISLLWLTGTLSFQRELPSVQPLTSKPVPAELATGETLFKLHCSICGETRGPRAPLAIRQHARFASHHRGRSESDHPLCPVAAAAGRRALASAEVR
jgi:hypothetical protein